MRQRRDPIPRATEAWWWLGGLLTLGIAGGAVVVAAIALWENTDIRRPTPALAEAPPVMPVPSPPPAAVVPGHAFEAVVLRSDASRSYFDDPEYYGLELERWAALLRSSGAIVSEASGAADLRRLRPEQLLVLAEAPCLSSAELAAVNVHLRAGGSVLANWAVGVRDGACAWRGWSTLLDLTGAEDLRELPPREGLFLTIPGGLALSPGFGPGTRIELRPDPSLALRRPGERVYWSDWALNPAPDAEGANADVAAVTRTTSAGGRVTWFGLRTRQGATPHDSARIDRLLENGIRWAGGLPMASPAPWPNASRAAMTFVLDVEGAETYVNARDAAAAFHEDRIPVTFFVVSALVEADASLAAALTEAGEVGTQTVDHTPLGGLTPQDQAMRLRRSWNEIEAWSGVGPAGLRPPAESYDSATIEAWRAAGGRYLLATNEARSAAPELHPTRDGPVVLLPRLLKDDYDIIVRDVTVRAGSLTDAYLAGTQKMRAIGGLAVVAGHTQILSSGPRLEAVRAVADSARARGDWWLARADEVAAWWLARSGLELRWEEPAGPTGTSRISELVVSATLPVDGLWLDVVAPGLADAIPTVDGVSVEHVATEWGVRVHVGSVSEGEARRLAFIEP